MMYGKPKQWMERPSSNRKWITPRAHLRKPKWAGTMKQAKKSPPLRREDTHTKQKGNEKQKKTKNDKTNAKEISRKKRWIRIGAIMKRKKGCTTKKIIKKDSRHTQKQKNKKQHTMREQSRERQWSNGVSDCLKEKEYRARYYTSRDKAKTKYTRRLKNQQNNKKHNTKYT